MKKILLSICLAVSVFALSGCADFLDREPYGRDTSWKTDEDVMKAVYALYYFVSPHWSEEICGRGHMWFECASDNVLIGRDRPAVDEIREFRMSPSNDQDVRNVWGVMYQNVAKANNIIKLVPDLSVSESVKHLAVGTAYFFRGFSMLWMVPYYGDDTNGGIPIILDTTPMDEMDSPRPDHVLKNYDQIIADFRRAAEELPYFSELSASQYGLPHKAAAWAFAARAALYAAQYDASYYNTWGYYTPSLELWNAFEEGDQRREATILYPGNHVKFMGRDITFGGYCTDGSISSYTTSHVSAGLINQKFISPWETGSYTEVSNQRDKLWNTLNVCLMRYADVLLMKAEALIWTQGEGNGEAKELLGDIRERAGLPRENAATKAELQNQRRCELAFEFQPSRHIDVIRWGLAQEYYAKPLHSVVSKMVDGQIKTEEVEVYPGRTFNPTYNKVFPIPETAFNGTVNLKQNKGY